jgi:hypothetical protein
MAKTNKFPVELPAGLIEERVIGISVAAQIADLSEWTMYDIIKRGKGPPTVRLCGRKIGIRKRPESLDREPRPARAGEVMTTLDPLPAFHRSVVRLACSACGAEANASCNCGKPYVPAGQRAAEAVAANPEKSNRAIAEKIGVDEKTVREARADQSAPETITGRDGKQYPAKRKLPSYRPDHEPARPEPERPVSAKVQEREADSALALQLISLGYRALAQKLQADPAAMARLNRVSDEMR